MINLSCRPAGANPAAGDDAYTPDRPARTAIPTIVLDTPGVTRADIRVMGHHCRMRLVYHSAENFESPETIARGARVSVRAVQAAHAKFVRLGWMEIRPGTYKESPVSVRRLLIDDQVDAGRAWAQDCAPGRAPAQEPAPGGAQEPAPVKGSENGENNANVSAALAPGGGEEPSTPDPEVTPTDPPPAPLAEAPAPAPAPARVLATPEECRKMLASPHMARFPVLAAPFLHDLLDQGEPLPAEWLARKLPPRPASDVPEVPRASGPPAPPAPPTIDAMVRALGTPEADAKAQADRVADKLVDELRDAMYRPFFKARTRDVVEGRIDPAKFARAVAIARKSTSAEKPGAIFTRELRRQLGFDGRWKDFGGQAR